MPSRRKKKQRKHRSRGHRVFFPQYLIFQVLQELPAKSLLRFRTVCKLWCSVIDDPFFAKHHLARSHTRGSDGIKLFFIKTHDHINVYEFYNVDLDAQGQAASRLRMLNVEERVCPWPTHNANGLVCFRHRIWNPTTNQSIRIPPLGFDAIYPSSTSEPGGSCEYKFNTDQVLFGYDGRSNAYKVLKFCYTRNIHGNWQLQKYPPRCKVWTVGTSVWRDFDISNIPSDLGYLDEDKSCTIGDVIYCLGGVGVDHGNCVPREWRIFAFDVRQEKLHNILSLPVSDFETKSYESWSFINVRGHLGLVDSKMTTIFVLGNKGYWREEKLLLPHEWRVSSTPKTSILNFHDPVEEGFMLVGSLPTGEVLFELTEIDQESEKIITCFSYNLVTKKTSKFLDLTGLVLGLQPREPYLHVLLLSYAESVIRLHAEK